MNAVKTLVVMLVMSLMFVPAAFAELNWGANVETNSTVEMDSDGSDTMVVTNDGRVEVVVEAQKANDSGTYVAGKGCFEVKVDGGLGECDVWFQLGNPSWSLKVGHFENEGIFAKGQDIFVAGTDASQWYELNKARGRAPDGIGILFNLGENMALDTKVSFDNNGSRNQFGVRPVLKLSSGSLMLKAGGEYYMEKPFDNDADDETSWFGAGANIEFTLGNLVLGGCGTYGKYEDTAVDDETGTTIDSDETVMSDTVYAKLAMGEATLGLGAGYTMEDEADTNEMYGFVSYDMPLPVEGARVKFGASFASGDNGSEDLTAYGARLRFWYGF